MVAAVPAAGSQACLVQTPTKAQQKKLNLLAKQVLGLGAADAEFGDHHADVIMTEALIQDIRDDKSLVKELWGKAQEKKAGRAVAGTEGVEIFHASTLKGIRPDWKFGWCVRNGDFTGEELVLAQQKFSESVDVLVEYATQLGMHLKLQDDCKYEPVIEKLLKHQHMAWGKRLSNWKAKGGVLADGNLNLKKMGYLPEWSGQGHLARITHCSGQYVDIEKKHGTKIDNNYGVTDNHNDHSAAFTMEMMPPIPIIEFFNEFKVLSVGPYAGLRFVEKKAQQRFALHVEQIKTEWVESRKKMSGSDGVDQLATPMKEHMLKKRQSSMGAAQQKAKALVAERGAMKVVTYK